MNAPKAYQQGWIEFYKLRFKVTPGVLIPRPETELLVDEVTRFIASHPEERNSDEGSKPLTILDIGTGSGCIAISIAKNLHPTSGVGVKIVATDVSEKALVVAKQNAKLHGVEDHIEFIQGNLLENLHYDRLDYHSKNSPDIIVTNLPYIPSERINYLDSSVKDFEPHVALDGGEDGFELCRKLFQQLKEKNWLARRNLGEGRKLKIFVGEIDYTHGELATIEAQKYFPNAKVEVKTDLAQRQRILLIQSP